MAHPRFLDVLVRVRPVDLVEVNHLHVEAAQAGFGLAADAFGFEPPVGGRLACVPDPAAFGGEDDLVPPAGDGLADNFF